MKIEERVKTVVLEVKEVETIRAKRKLYDDFCSRFNSCAICPIFKMNTTIARSIDCELTLHMLAENGIDVLKENFEVRTPVL